jgi:hypothetical protein
MCVRSISSNRNKVVGSCSCRNAADRGKRFVRNARGVGNGKGSSSGVQNKGTFSGREAP